VALGGLVVQKGDEKCGGRDPHGSEGGGERIHSVKSTAVRNAPYGLKYRWIQSGMAHSRGAKEWGAKKCSSTGVTSRGGFTVAVQKNGEIRGVKHWKKIGQDPF